MNFDDAAADLHQVVGVVRVDTLSADVPPIREAGDPRRSSYGLDYWLRRCEGFRVESPAGRIGTVRGVRFGSSPEPETLEVRAGRLGRRLLLIPVAQVEQIVPAERRIVLRASPELVGTLNAERG